MPEDTPSPHIPLNPRGVPCLVGTRHRVFALVASDAQAERQRHTPHPRLIAAQARQAGSGCGRPEMCP